MPLETATYVADLNTSNPSATDAMAQGDDHLRLLKSVLKAQFPNFTSAALTTSNAQIDALQATAAGGTVTAATTVTAGTHFVGGGGELVPTGLTGLWWTDTLPTGYLWCNGAAVSRTTFAALFALFGTLYGAGNGSTTFNLPDLRDNVPVGKGTMGAVAAAGRITNYVTSSIATFIGACTHVLTTGELPVHTPTGTIGGSQILGSIFQGPEVGAAGGAGRNAPSVIGSLTINGSNFTFSGDPIGSGTPHDNVQPGIVCNYIIKT